MDDVELGKRVQDARGIAGWSMRRLADSLGLDPSAMRRTEMGERSMKARELVAASTALGVPLDVLVCGTSVEVEAAARRAQALAEAASMSVSDWLGAAVAASAAFHMEVSDELPSELETAAIWGDSGGLPVRRTVTVAAGTADIAQHLLDELAGTFQFEELPPTKDDTHEDKDTENGR